MAFVYLLVVDDVIYKIGGSSCKSGIKGTMGFYASANTGKPSIRSFGIMCLIARELLAGRSVDVYLVRFPPVEAEVPGLFTKSVMPVFPYKEMEAACIADYISIEDSHPAWNFQEQGFVWGEDIRTAHNQLRTTGQECVLPLDMQAVKARRTS